MRLDIASARDLIERALAANGYGADEARDIGDHLMDCELRGLGYAGLARAVAIIQHDRRCGLKRGPVSIVKETPVSARIDGGDDLGYLVANRATALAIEKCAASGIAVVGASRTHFTGMYSYYLEKVAARGFVGMIAGSGPSMVAPHGGTEPRFSTNPIAFGFPCAGREPVIWDISTASTTHAEVLLARRLGQSLPEGLAYDGLGRPTTEPDAVLAGGALTAWGGHRGSGLAMSVQLLAMMAGQTNVLGRGNEPADFGYLIIVVNPDLLGAGDAFAEAVAGFCDSLRATRPLDPGVPVRVPFERSAQRRRETLRDGRIEVPDLVVTTLREMAETDSSFPRTKNPSC